MAGIEYNLAYFKKRVSSFLTRRVLPAPISVIVPVYNGQNTITRCLDCLLNQSQRRIKIICVDDGSTDETPQILERYRKKHHRIKVIHQKNGGKSVARNIGLSVAKTKYIMFCDDDDEYKPVMCENMLDAIKKNEVDLVVCGVRMVYKDHENMRESDNEYYRLKYEGLKDISDDLIINTNGSVCNKIFRLEIIRNYDINFPNKIETAEDFYFYNAYISMSNLIYFLNQDLYIYIRRDDSTMSDNFKKRKASIDDLLAAKNLFTFYRKNNYLNSHKDLFWRQWITCFWASYIYSAKEYYPEVKKEATKFLSDNYEKYKPTDIYIQHQIDKIKKVMKKIKEKDG